MRLGYKMKFVMRLKIKNEKKWVGVFCKLILFPAKLFFERNDISIKPIL
jgi:hypothetical protein